MKQQLLVVDDEASILRAFQRAFDTEDTTVLTATNAAEADAAFRKHHPDVVVLDLSLPDGNGLELFKKLRTIDARVPVIFITGEAIVGHCRAMKEVYQAIGQVAGQNLTVLLLGESGTGKEVVAQAIYHHSDRVGKPFQIINCAAIPDALLESEIFGHEKGAFTDAHRQRIGKLEQADGGTLFLDEVGDMSPMTQAKLLRVLQDQTFERVGGNTPIQVDTRIIAATNHDLKSLVDQGDFRADLYFRLSGFTIHLPPLRERGDDLRILAEYFLRKYSSQFGRDLQSVSDEALQIMQSYPWPGNVRELESVIKRALLTARGNVLLPEFLPAEVTSPNASGTDCLMIDEAFVDERLQNGTTNLYDEALARFERQLLSQVLAHTCGNQLKAAGILGISRVTLRSKLRALHIDAGDFQPQ